MSPAPVQLLVVGFDRPTFGGEVLAELERLRASDVVRVIDLLVVHKRAGGVVERLHHPALPAGHGAVVAALIGLEATNGDDGGGVAGDEDVWSLDQAIPENYAAAIALVEHRWASGLRDAIASARGTPLADAWIHPADLAAAGLNGAGER